MRLARLFGSRRALGHLISATCTGLVVALVPACSGSSSTQVAAPSESRPAGPVADLSHQITGGNGVFMGSAITVDLAQYGYVEQEYLATGVATSYSQVGSPSADGRFTFTPSSNAPYRTRIVVRRPANPAKFSGTVIVEWLNVSGGLDADPEWASLYEQIIRSGDAWVGVSAQSIGVMGGPVLVAVPGVGSNLVGKGLRAIDPARYGSLYLPGDGFSFDIYTQVARALRTGAALGGLKPKLLIAAGESQSAFALVTYYDGVQPLTHEFDGFFVHSRGEAGLPLVGPGQDADIAGAINATAVIFRTDGSAPVLDLQSESDVTGILDSYAARQPDSNRFRLWEVAGTSHVDAHLLGPLASSINCGAPINNGPMNLVAKAALSALTTWVETGKPPPIAPRLDIVADPTPQIQRDAYGIALGGIRTPPVDVPVATLSGAPGPNPSIICLLLGSTKPFSASQLAQLYPSRSVYLQRYDADANATIKAGWVLFADRSALLAFADPSAIPA